MSITALTPWYGSNRLHAAKVGELLRGCEWVGVPFAGSMCELNYITARTMLVNDLHEEQMNLAMTVISEDNGPRLIRMLRRTPFHESIHQIAKAQLKSKDDIVFGKLISAYHYFIACWMSRNGSAGTDREFDASFSYRRDAAGGDSNRRFRNATEALLEWRKIMQRCTFVVRDAFDFLKKECLDRPKHGIYCDPPFPDGGDKYKHKFTCEQHKRLAESLGEFHKTKVVVRYYDHQLVRDLYTTDKWDWIEFEGRKQTNGKAPEVLIVNKVGAA